MKNTLWSHCLKMPVARCANLKLMGLLAPIFLLCSCASPEKSIPGSAAAVGQSPGPNLALLIAAPDRPVTFLNHVGLVPLIYRLDGKGNNGLGVDYWRDGNLNNHLEVPIIPGTHTLKANCVSVGTAVLPFPYDVHKTPPMADITFDAVAGNTYHLKIKMLKTHRPERRWEAEVIEDETGKVFPEANPPVLMP